jgi:hypothetical protein
MRSYIRHVLDERMLSRGIAAEEDSSAGAGGRGEVRRSMLNELVRQRGEGDRFFRVRVDAERDERGGGK